MSYADQLRSQNRKKIFLKDAKLEVELKKASAIDNIELGSMVQKGGSMTDWGLALLPKVIIKAIHKEEGQPEEEIILTSKPSENTTGNELSLHDLSMKDFTDLFNTAVQFNSALVGGNPADPPESFQG